MRHAYKGGMSVKFVVLRKKTVMTVLIVCLAAMSAWLLYSTNQRVVPTGEVSKENERVIHMVTGEFEAKTADGKEIEAYRWDPGTIVVEKGEKVKLSIYGVNGKEHPFYIEGTDIKGTVKQGKETIVPLQFDKEGTYRLICLTHPDIQHNGPMIAYIVVD